MPAQPITAADLANRFAYHPPLAEVTKVHHEEVRDICHQAARHLVDLMPPGREASLAVTHLEDAMMWANAAIARGNS